MDIKQRIVSDMCFCLANAEEFMVQGRFSLTRAMRTVAALNEEATKAEFVEALTDVGYNAHTVAKQFVLSRRIDAEG